VDDRAENLLAIEAILATQQYRLVRATSGPEALGKILEHDFAVILIDVVMPGMDGFAVVELVKRRERSRHVPIIFLSAAGSKMDFIYRAYSVGAVDYLMKPIEADVLRAKVAIFVELFRKDRHIREQAEALRIAERHMHEQRYRNLAEAIPQIVWTAAADGEITYCNRHWYGYTGLRADQAHNRHWLASIAPEDAPAWTAGWRAGLSGTRVFELECRLRRHDDVYRWHLCRAVPETENGRIVAWLGTFTDCDDLKRAVQARDEFLSIASHELRTPLTTLQLQLQSLERGLAGAPDVISRKLDSCLRQGGRLVTLVDSLFDFSRITSGKLTLNRQHFDLATAVREVATRLAELAARSGTTVSVEAERVIEGFWDRLRIEQVIENLVNNAIKYGANSPVTLVVTADDQTARIAVTDRGPGIPTEDLPRIFGPFERATSHVSFSGLGLGLYIAREYTGAHGGTIAASSVPGKSTTFTIALPRAHQQV